MALCQSPLSFHFNGVYEIIFSKILGVKNEAVRYLDRHSGCSHLGDGHA